MRAVESFRIAHKSYQHETESLSTIFNINENSGAPKASRRAPSESITNLIYMEPNICRKSFNTVAKGAEILSKIVKNGSQGWF